MGRSQLSGEFCSTSSLAPRFALQAFLLGYLSLLHEWFVKEVGITDPAFLENLNSYRSFLELAMIPFAVYPCQLLAILPYVPCVCYIYTVIYV